MQKTSFTDNKYIRRIKTIWINIKVNRRLHRYLTLMGYLFFIVLFLYTLLNLNIMFIEEIEILTEEELIFTSKEKIEKDLINNIGKRLYQINLNKEEKSLKDKNIFIQEVEIEKIFPSKLQVKVVERKALLVLNRQEEKGLKQYIISQDLWVISECRFFKDICEDLPKAVLTDDLLKVSLQKRLNCKSLDTIAKIEIFLSEKEILAKMYYIPIDGLTVVELEDNTRIIFTTEKAISDQLDAFLMTRETLLLQGREYKELDLRYERPIIRVDKYTL